MKRLIYFIFAVFASAAQAQENSKNNQSNKSWEVNSTWVDGTAPGYTAVGSSGVDFNIFGYVSLGSSSVGRNLVFENNHPTLTFTVRDTLVVYGNMTFGTDAMTLSVPAGGLLIVFGALDVNNKVDIANGGNIVVTGEFKLTGAQADVTVAGAGKFYAGSYNNGAQTEVGNGPPDASLNTGSDLQANLPGVYAFVQSAGSSPLPIELKYFKAEVRSRSVQLSWATASELNFDYFNLLRSTDGVKFELISTLKGNGTTKETHVYDYSDQSPILGTSYYRLQSVDFDGFTETFNVIAVNFEGARELTLYPVPVTDANLTLHLNFEPTVDIRVSVTTIAGVEQTRGVIKAHETQLNLDLPLEAGIYLVKLSSSDFNRVSRIVVK